MPGIERKLVRRDIEHPRLLIEHRLRPVAVVHVDVDNRDPLETAGEHRGSGDGDVVEQAEAHRAMRLQRGGLADARAQRQARARHRVLRRLNRRARGKPSDVVGVRRRERVRVEHDRLTRRRRHLLDVRLRVHAQKLIVASPAVG